MHWSAEEFAIGITALLFLAAVASSFLPRVELTSATRAAFAIGAAAFAGAAALVARTEEVTRGPVVWALPVAAAVWIVLALAPTMVRAEPSSAPAARASVLHPATSTELSPSMRALRGRAESPRTSAQELTQIACRHPHLRDVVAANPSTPANVLEWLASLGDSRVRDSIAARTTQAA